MNASKIYYNDTYSLKQNAFQVRKKPILTNWQVYPTSEGWGYNFTVNVTVTDPDTGDTITVNLWKSYDGANWIYVDSQTKTGCAAGCNVNFYPTLSCSDYLNGPTIYFKFNATDSYGLKNETSSFTATLEKDNVNFQIVQSTSIINREGEESGTFVVRVNDTDRGDWVNISEEPDGIISGMFWFTKEPTIPTWDSGWYATVNSTGHMGISFNPNCSYAVGLQYWKVGISGNDCYADTNMTEASFNIRGQLKTNLYKPPKFSEFNVTNLINIGWNVYSDCYGIAGAYDSGNISEVTNTLNLYNFNNISTCVEINEPFPGNYNCTWNSTSQPQGNWTINIQASKLNYNSNNTNYTSWFYLKNWAPVVSNLQVSPNVGGWGAIYNFSAYVTDQENDTVTCKLYVNTTGGFVFKGSNSTSTPGTCYVVVNDFTCLDQSNASFYFVVNDTFNSVNTSETLGITQGPNITKNSVSITLIQGNNSVVNRSDQNPVGNVTRFILKINDTTRNSPPLENTNGSIWITYDFTNYYRYFVQTNGSGYINFDFDPDCSGPHYQTGKQYWIAAVIDDYCYATTYTNSTPSQNYSTNIIGDLVRNILSPRGGKYLRGD
ncbi:MAG: hypothetical protein QXP32_09245, partial [Nitrososphaeria archaeon]